jgi:PKD repeat protein
LPPVANFTGYPTKVCAGNTIQFTDTSANQPTNWNWTFPGGSPTSSTLQSPTVTYGTPGKYYAKLIVSNVNGSDSIVDSNYITIYPVPPLATITQSANLDTLTCSLTGMASYQWYLNGQPISGGSKNEYYSVWRKGAYSVFCLDSNGCSTYRSKSIIVASVQDVTLDNYVKVFPNPTEGNIQLQFNLPKPGTYIIVLADMLGQVLYTDKKDIAGPYTQRINLADFGKGVYILSIKGQGTQLQKKIIVY